VLKRLWRRLEPISIDRTPLTRPLLGSGFGHQRHHCIKPSRRSEDPTGEEGGVDAFGLLLR